MARSFCVDDHHPVGDLPVRTLIATIEPIIWLLFGGGFMVGCLLLPAYIFVLGVAHPMGWVPEGALAFERIHPLASGLIGRIVLLHLIVLPLWNAANHLRHYVIDWGHYDEDGWVAPLFYTLALVGTIVAVVAVIRI